MTMKKKRRKIDEKSGFCCVRLLLATKKLDGEKNVERELENFLQEIAINFGEIVLHRDTEKFTI